MSLRISGKNMDLGEALSTRIHDRISDCVDKYFDGGFSGKVTVEKQGSQFQADCMIHLDTGIVLQASGKDGDPTASFDQAADRVEKRLRRYKRRLKDHKAHSNGADFAAAYTVMQSPDEDEEVAEDYAPAIIAEGATSVRTQTVAMAVMQLDLMDTPVNVFRNAATGEVNVVYRRADGNIGWVDPGSTPNMPQDH